MVICAWLSLVGSHCCVTFGSFLEVVGVYLSGDFLLEHVTVLHLFHC